MDEAGSVGWKIRKELTDADFRVSGRKNRVWTFEINYKCGGLSVSLGFIRKCVSQFFYDLYIVEEIVCCRRYEICINLFT